MIPKLEVYLTPGVLQSLDHIVVAHLRVCEGLGESIDGRVGERSSLELRQPVGSGVGQEGSREGGDQDLAVRNLHTEKIHFK